MILLKTSFTLLFLFALGCGSSTTNSSEGDVKNENMTMQTENKMTAAGFTKGTIVASTIEGDCPFTIKVETIDSYLLDPVNLDASYQKDGEKIWVKYVGMRMANRCEKANPVTISEIQKRAE